MGDSTRLRQILSNLVGNAIKFTERGEVAVHVGVDSKGADEVLLKFSVSDTGIGVSSEQQKAIFDPFSQADSSTTRKYGGSGLGLAICDQLVKMMGGRLWMESEAGQGSIFYFTAWFELQKGDVVLQVQDAKVESLRDLPVLVVDDNATNRYLLQQILTSWHMVPTTVDCGQAALDEMENAQHAGAGFPLALIDLRMNGMDGFELAERIARMRGCVKPAIVMLTSDDPRGDFARGQALGIKTYIAKPVRQSRLLDAVQKALGKELASEDSASPTTVRASEKSVSVLRILVAEDTIVNQKVVVYMLEKQGHSVVVVSDGEKALEALMGATFDLVLMDVQMPVMNGFDATAAIRGDEKLSGTHLPIIAITSNALKGDRERCLEAGMDEYISKPIKAKELMRVVESVTTIPYETRQGETRTNVRWNEDSAFVDGEVDEVIDKFEVLAWFGGDHRLFKLTAEESVRSYRQILHDIRKSIALNDSEGVWMNAHKIKGILGYFCPPAVSAALKVEEIGRSGDLVGAEQGYLDLKSEIDRLQPALLQLIEECDL